MSRDTASPSTPDHPVWQRLSCYQIGPDDAALSFAARLARENGWSADHAVRVIVEYRKFAFLAVTGDGEMTPSDAVDQAWHLHLTYTRDYWERFCPEVLGKPMHHGPTTGGNAERGRFFRQYADTLKRYEAVFGPAPADIWPSARQRLLEDPRARRVHPRDGIVISRKAVRRAMVALLMVAAIALLFWWRT